MGREIRRVPLDFDFPLDETWTGFLRGDTTMACMACDGYGNHMGSKQLEEFCRRVVMVGECSSNLPEDFKPQRGTPLTEQQARFTEIGKRWPFTMSDPVEVLEGIIGEKLSEEHAWIVRRCAHVIGATHGGLYQQTAHYVWDENRKRTTVSGQGPDNKYINFPHPYILEDGIKDPTRDFHEVVRKIPGIRTDGFLGWDGYHNLWSAVAEQLGLEEKWYLCARCEDGEGVDPMAKAAHDAWEETPVPEGPGYQLWQTVSEGGPVSPVFEKPEGLAQWLVDNESAGSLEAALKWVNGPGWAPSSLGAPGKGVMSGVEFMTQDGS